MKRLATISTLIFITLSVALVMCYAPGLWKFAILGAFLGVLFFNVKERG